LLHAAWHARLSLIDLGFTVDTFGALFFFLFDFALIHRNSASNWYFVRSESRALALRIETCIRISVAFSFHFRLVALPKRKWLLTLFGNLKRFLLNFKTAFFVLVLDLLVPGYEHSCRDWFAAELVGHHTLFLHFFFHDHCFDLFLSDGFGLDSFSSVKFEW